MLTSRRAANSFVLLVLSISVAVSAQNKVAAQRSEHRKLETPHLAFVTEYVRELSAIETIRTSSQQDQARESTDDMFLNAIYGFTRMQLELRTQIKTLKSMRLDPPFEKVIPFLTDFYAYKIELFQRLIDISTAQSGGPKRGVDYGKLGAETPKVRAALDDTDHSLFEVTPMIFATLVDRKADSQNHASHLIITGAERAQLLSDITTDFGSKLYQEAPSFQVSAAALLKAALLKDFKSSDDPWD
jgi:hypothetical protein